MTLDGNIFCSNAKQRHGNSAETFRPRFAIISQERFPGKAACDVGISAAFITIIDDGTKMIMKQIHLPSTLLKSKLLKGSLSSRIAQCNTAALFKQIKQVMH